MHKVLVDKRREHLVNGHKVQLKLAYAPEKLSLRQLRLVAVIVEPGAYLLMAVLENGRRQRFEYLHIFRVERHLAGDGHPIKKRLAYLRMGKIVKHVALAGLLLAQETVQSEVVEKFRDLQRRYLQYP